MILGPAILLSILAIGYWHYVQGLFTATLSAICAILAAIVAVSYHESIIAMLLKGAIANQAQGATLVFLFAIVYVLLRQFFDRLVPGNVRYPVLMDKVGAGVMGIVAGLFATGVLAMAAQALPF